MAKLRPAKCYRKLERPYTRKSKKKPRISYVKGVPESKIRKFETGDRYKKFPLRMFLVARRSVQIRHNALEAARIASNKFLSTKLGNEFFLKILVYPHHVLRENKLATGAGADRYSQGMRLAFGKPIGTAARVKENQKLIEVRVNEDGENMGKEALKRASMKLPTPCKIIIEQKNA